jgi:hypothetical protein
MLSYKEEDMMRNKRGFGKEAALLPFNKQGPFKSCTLWQHWHCSYSIANQQDESVRRIDL